MNFSSPELVRNTISEMRQNDRLRAKDRALINSLYNGEPPYTKEEEATSNVSTNVNFLEPTVLALKCRQQLNNAFLKPGNRFSVTLDSGPPHRRREWGHTITRHINRPITKSLPYTETRLSTNAQVVLHGVGPVIWISADGWSPSAKAIEDVQVPTNTRRSLDNLDHFAIFMELTPGELYRRALTGKGTGWNTKLVRQALDKLTPINSEAGPRFSFIDNPEKMAELFKQNLGYYMSDAVPTVDCWDFYYREEETDDEKWHRVIVLDQAPSLDTKNQFLYESPKIYAKHREHFFHVQFADVSSVAPFLYHSVRSIGYLNYGLCHLQNRARCRFADSFFENQLWYFRVSSADELERVQKIDLTHKGIMPEGARFVTPEERFQVNENLVNMFLSQNRQLMAERNTIFTQDIDDGKSKEMTATETMARVNESNAMVSAALNLAYTYQEAQYQEIARRFCLKNSRDKDIKTFREKCITDGVPEEMLDVERWNIEVERVLGGGNKILELAQVEKLMQWRTLYSGDAQTEILHIATEATTDDPQLADRLVKIGQRPTSNAKFIGQTDAATLMAGLPLDIRQEINHIDYVEALLTATDATIQKIEARGGMASPEELVGLNNLDIHTEAQIQIIAQDPEEKQRVKQYQDALGKMMNMVKAYTQRLQEQAQQSQQGSGASPEAQAKIVSAGIVSQAKAQNMRESHAQRSQQREESFILEEKRKQQQHDLDMARQMNEVQVSNTAEDLKTQAEILRKRSEPPAQTQ